MAGGVYGVFNDEYGEGGRLSSLEQTARECLKLYISPHQVYARKVNLLKNKYKYQIVLKVPESDFLMFKLSVEERLRNEIFASNPLPDDLEIVCEKS